MTLTAKNKAGKTVSVDNIVYLPNLYYHDLGYKELTYMYNCLSARIEDSTIDGYSRLTVPEKFVDYVI